MSYIPTIHTFKDDLEENKTENDLSISDPSANSSNVEEFQNKNHFYNDVQIPENQDQTKSSTKIILISISVFFILASFAAVFYYFHSKKQIAKEQELQNQKVLIEQELEKKRAGIVEEIKTIFPNLFLNTKISEYLSNIIFKDNIIIANISTNEKGESNYQFLYTLIIANEKDFKKDLISTFKLNDISQTMEIPIEIISTSTATTSTTTIKNKKKVKEIIEIVSTTSTTTMISTTTILKIKNLNDIIFENKTIENQDYKIADTGVGTLVYGYALNNKYFIAATTIKDFLETIKKLE